MKSTRLSFETAAYYLSAGAVVSVLFSIAISNILLVLALVALLLSNQRMRFPPFWIPLAVFFAGTALSLALSPDPSYGRPALRKFFCFLIVLVVTSSIRTISRVRMMLVVATGVMALSGLWSLVQFAHKVTAAQDLGRPFYTYYMQERITGFMSHWMTLGGQEMILILMAGSLIFFSAERRLKLWLAGASVAIAVSIAAGYTRSIWLGTFVGAVYLIWYWKRWVLVLIPVPVILLLLLNPFAVRDRIESAFQPHGDTDSNAFRVAVRRAGIAMIKVHPWFGLGPEEVKAHLKEWIPADVPRPLPTGWYGHTHNLYVQYAAERGIPTLLALLWMLGKILYDFLRGLGRSGPEDAEARAILRGAVAMMLGILVVGYFEVNLGDSEVLILFLSIVSCGYIALDHVGQAKTAAAA
jgi:putative inorganic carbon (HCO3(-)) transporter